MPNRLADETSPYLLQHKDNPVDWYPWGPEALQRARDLDRPILLSVGYSACHWCHVMERESFEDEATAAVMNEKFVNIKVDREERPDLDEIYMKAVQAFTGGHGGWPMTVFLTPDGRPFMGGTYFPPESSRGMPAFQQVLEHAHSLWTSRRGDSLGVAGQVAAHIEQSGDIPPATGELPDDWLTRVAVGFEAGFDEVNGGPQGAPKFPPHGSLACLLAHAALSGSSRALQLATRTLDGMARGGMYDLLGGGFARYSVDDAWVVPHFEKMLYDNAQLLPLYVDAWKLTGAERYARVARQTADYLLRDLCSPEGAFYSSEDADSEGVEGKFYAWTPRQLREVLGLLDGARAATLFDVSDEGSFEHGTSVLRVSTGDLPAEDLELLERVRPKLLQAREQRVRPGLDDKVLTAWNGLAISALARAGAALDEPRYLAAAVRAAEYLLGTMAVDGRLMRASRAGKVQHLGYLDDHANLVNALLDLWETTFELRWLEEANALADRTVDLFWGDGGLYYTGRDAEALITRSRNLIGGAEPSGAGMAALAFARLAVLSDRADLGERADHLLRPYVNVLAQAPRALGPEAMAGAWRTGRVRELGIVGEGAGALLAEVRRRVLPLTALAHVARGPIPERLPWMAGQTPKEGRATAYLCENRACRAPTTDAGELGRVLDERARADAPSLEQAPALPTDPRAWLNTGAPLSLDGLMGHVVVLDFWTSCCVNCQHVLPELAALERRFEGKPVVVIGVHSAKFPAEQELHHVQAAVEEHGICHPVVLDSNHAVWDSYGVRSWPTVVVLDVLGRVAWQRAGEVGREELSSIVERLLADGEVAAEPAWSAGRPGTRGDGLRFPGKVAVWPDNMAQAFGKDPFDDGRLYVADTGNHRILEARLSLVDGQPAAELLRVFGLGEPGLSDGLVARFNHPRGLVRVGNSLWVADTGNHALRRVDLLTGQVHTVAGTGRRGVGPAEERPPLQADLRSPWDVAATGGPGAEEADAVLIAMAGSHQLWAYVPDNDSLGPIAGNGAEDHVDGHPAEAALAQPSGLSIAGRFLFFADAETSSIRVMDMNQQRVGTVVGRGLFDWGDEDGPAAETRLQHPEAVAAAFPLDAPTDQPTGLELFVADTYNGKIKLIDLSARVTRTLCGGVTRPGGLAVAGDWVFVADTGGHRIVTVQRQSGRVCEISGLDVATGAASR